MLLGGIGAGTATVLAQQSALSRTQSATPVPAATTTTSAPAVVTPRTTTTTRQATTTRTRVTTTKSPKTTTPSPTRTPPKTTTPKPPSPEELVVDLVNRERARQGCDPVTVDARLTEAATGHSEDMARRDYFSHVTPEGIEFGERIKAAGYPSPGAENIAEGYRSASDVMAGWMDSPGHRDNILNCELTTIGVGLDDSAWVWTQNFGY